MERRLAADVVDYSRLIGLDEAGTLSELSLVGAARSVWRHK
jgi:hypothetical protein